MARVPETLVSGLQNDSRKIGEVQATRIGKALGLSGNELQEFVYVALNESKGRLLNSSKIYCAEILNYLPNLIAINGIRASGMGKAVSLQPDFQKVSRMVAGQRPQCFQANSYSQKRSGKHDQHKERDSCCESVFAPL